MCSPLPLPHRAQNVPLPFLSSAGILHLTPSSFLPAPLLILSCLRWFDFKSVLLFPPFPRIYGLRIWLCLSRCCLCAPALGFIRSNLEGIIRHLRRANLPTWGDYLTVQLAPTSLS
ncbi:hypothetical protein VTJ04DRAFT_7916 [Mycothermus thermophilus]|uniref:uncharacterized protein n=1 Tax=Humicola insolens TaxID=85995 RepID=UPI0037431845